MAHYYTKYYNEDELNRERNPALHSAKNCSVYGKVFLAPNNEKNCENCKILGGGVILYN